MRARPFTRRPSCSRHAQRRLGSLARVAQSGWPSATPLRLLAEGRQPGGDGKHATPSALPSSVGCAVRQGLARSEWPEDGSDLATS